MLPPVLNDTAETPRGEDRAAPADRIALAAAALRTVLPALLTVAAATLIGLAAVRLWIAVK